MDSNMVDFWEALKVSRLFANGIITNENIFNELGLMIFHEYGDYGIIDNKKWMLGKIKYGI